MEYNIKFPFIEYYFDKQDFWAKFNPSVSLSSSSNYAIFGETSERLKKFLNDLKSRYQEEFNKIKWLVFSLWDPFRDEPKFFILLVSHTNNNNLEFINPFIKDNNEYKYPIDQIFQGSIYQDYLDWLYNKFNSDRDIKIHFWDYLHNFKKFCWPICITKNKDKLKELRENYFVILLDNSNIQYYSPEIPNITNQSEDWWYWDNFKPILKPGEDAKNIFENLIKNYFKYLGEKVGANFLYEFPMTLDAEIEGKKIWFRSVASVSIGATQSINYKFWEYIIYGHLKSFYQIFLTRSFFVRFKQNALRSAVAAIIGRNASHTIGSHALSYLSEPKNLEDIYSYEEISKFYRYLQGRLDYIAEASTSEPKWSETVEFKNDILIPFIEQKILLDNINRSEYIINESGDRVEMRAEKYEFILKIKNETFRFRYERDTNGSLTLKKEIGKMINGNLVWQPYQDDGQSNRIIIDCPHGIVGRHAFYSFLENFIRNSCRHGGEDLKKILSEPNERLRITIEIKNNEKDSDLIDVKIYDNLGNCTDEVKDKINKYIKGEEKDFCDETGKLRGGAWGIYEMRIGTGWLRQASILDISANSLEPPILKIDNPSNNITYEFYLLRPLNYLFVTEDKNIKGDIDKGIYKIKNLSELEALYKERKLRHKFVIIEVKSKDEIEWLKQQENQIKLPFRTFVFYNDDNFKNGIEELKNKFVCVKGKIPDIENIQQLYDKYINWLYDKNDSLPKLNIIWSDLEDNKYYKPDLNSVDVNAIIYKHGMEPNDINKLENENKNPLFFQPFSSSVPENIVGRKLADYKNSKREDIIYELYEIGLFRILIADERIFKKVCEKTISTLEGIVLGNSYKLWEVWKWMGVDIIDIKREENDIYVWTPDEGGKKMEMNEFFNNKKWTIFLIHQGIIDEQLKSEFFNSAFITNYQNCFRQIFIHSGRGEVKIEKGFKFVELSNLENYVIDNPNKYRLVNLLAKVIGGKET